MTQQYKTLDFVKGDLVYFVGYEGPSDSNELGVVTDVKVGESHFPLYEVHWFKKQFKSTHTAAHIGHAPGTDLKDRVNDRGEGD